MADGLAAATALVGAVTNDDRLILNPATPLESARELVQRNYFRGLMRTLHHQIGVFYAWTGTNYAETAEEEIRADICRFLDSAQRFVDDNKLVAFDPTPRHINEVLAMLRTAVQLPGRVRPPTWVDQHPHPPAVEIFCCENGLLHLPTATLHPHTPAFFSMNAVEYPFDPHAPEPREWLAFLHEIWPGDDEAIGTLQQAFGYLLAADTAQQKLFLIVGPPRSGKGTIARVLTGLLGAGNVVGPTLAGLSGNFGLAPLIGKPLAIISDARLGGRVDQHIIVERLLAISGEDRLTVDRKHREPWTGKLPTRFLILTNELPKLYDASGALASRFIILRLQRDFLGREDHGLSARLLRELPGILNWAIEGWLGVRWWGRFAQPASSLQMIQTLEDLSSPTRAFLRDRVVIGAGNQVECDRLFAAWVEWCRQQGRDHPGTAQSFGRDLHAAQPGLTIARPRTEGHKRPRSYEGIALAERRAEGPTGAWAAPQAGVG